MSWRVAYSLDTYLAELNAVAPDRSIASDGTVGDLSHAARDSDHNPNDDDVVRAADVTHDPVNGLSCDRLAVHLVDLIARQAHPALGSGAYVIWDRRIFSADRRTAGWRAYTGSNPHEAHLHLSVATRAAGYDSTAPWGLYPQEDDVTPEQTQKMIDAALTKFAAEAGDRIKLPHPKGEGAKWSLATHVRSLWGKE